MPNWCLTNITINGNENDLKVFDKLLDQWTSRNYIKNGFGHSWLGNIVLGSGIGTVDTNPETDIRCRGSITQKQLCDDMLDIQMETAWVPMLDMWVKLVEKFIPEADITYTAEEHGCGIFCTNDPDLVDKYVVDSWDDDIESDWEMEEKTLIEILQKLMNTNETDIYKLSSLLYEGEYDISINKWEYKEVTEW
jgi:hypothetical protein